jgi:hypothetical protein
MECPSPIIGSPLRLVEVPQPDEEKDRRCSQHPPSNSPRTELRSEEHDDSLEMRLSQMTMKNKRLQAALQQRTAEQFQRMRSFEEVERQNRLMVEGLKQFQEALCGLQQQVQTLQKKVDAILGKL